MFFRLEDEKRVCDTLKALVEEFGPEQVVVALPESWYDKQYTLGRCVWVFTTVDEIRLSVPDWDVEWGMKIKVQEKVYDI